MRFGQETGKKESFTLVVGWKKTEQESSVFILFMPSWLRNQRAYAGLVLTRHYNKLSYHRISLGSIVNSDIFARDFGLQNKPSPGSKKRKVNTTTRSPLHIRVLKYS